MVLDTAALLAYMKGTPIVGDYIARTANRKAVVLVPVLCLAEAYRQASAEETLLLDLMQNIDNVMVTPAEPDMAVFLGGFTKKLGRMDLAHAVITTSEYSVVPIMTSERHLVTKLLAKEWPIIDL